MQKQRGWMSVQNGGESYSFKEVSDGVSQWNDTKGLQEMKEGHIWMSEDRIILVRRMTCTRTLRQDVPGVFKEEQGASADGMEW
jgi:hypothetical protein